MKDLNGIIAEGLAVYYPGQSEIGGKIAIVRDKIRGVDLHALQNAIAIVSPPDRITPHAEFISKQIGVPLAELDTKIQEGERLAIRRTRSETFGVGTEATTGDRFWRYRKWLKNTHGIQCNHLVGVTDRSLANLDQRYTSQMRMLFCTEHLYALEGVDPFKEPTRASAVLDSALKALMDTGVKVVLRTADVDPAEYSDNAFPDQRGLRWLLSQPKLIEAELVTAEKYGLPVVFSFVRTAQEWAAGVEAARKFAPTVQLGLMVETPLIVHSIPDLPSLSMAYLGLGDLTKLLFGASRPGWVHPNLSEKRELQRYINYLQTLLSSRGIELIAPLTPLLADGPIWRGPKNVYIRDVGEVCLLSEAAGEDLFAESKNFLGYEVVFKNQTNRASPTSSAWHKVSVTRSERDAVSRVLDSGCLTCGNEIENFEQEFAAWIGRHHAIAVSSGTSALQMILTALDVNQADVIVPSFTFTATVAAIYGAGARPVYVDIDPDNLCLDPNSVAKAINPKVKAVVGVDLFGNLVNWKALSQVVDDHMMIEDACQALGSGDGAALSGTFGTAAAFSFFANKILATGEGGMIVTDDDNLAVKLRRLRSQGRLLSDEPGIHRTLGYNFRMTEIQAAIGRCQLSRIEDLLAHRGRQAQAIHQNISDLGLETYVQPLVAAHPSPNPMFMFPLSFAESVNVDQLIVDMANRGFGVKRTYIPVHRQPGFEHLPFEVADLTHTNKLAYRILSLPILPDDTPDDAVRIVSALADSLR